MGTTTQDFQSLKEKKSYYVLSECISSDHKYLDGAPLSHEGAVAENEDRNTCGSAGAFPVSWTP